jgi:hypothetical protein
MTFVIAKVIDPDAGKVTLFSDTKLTDQYDCRSTAERRSAESSTVELVTAALIETDA